MLIDFQATNIRNAFIINSFAVALICVFSITLKDYIYSKYKKQLGHMKLVVLFVATFCASMATYISMYMVTGFGGGMLSRPAK